MTILFFKDAEISPFLGGIARINYTLSKSLEALGYRVIYMGVGKRSTDEDLINQHWLPDKSNLLSPTNISYLHDFIHNESVDIIINSYFDKRAFCLINKSREGTAAKIIFWFHNNIIEYASLWGYRNEKKLLDRNLSLLYKLATNRLVVKILRFIGSLKHRSLTHVAYDTSDKIVVVSKGNINEFLFVLGRKDYSQKVISINNYVPPITECQFEKKNNVVWCGAINFDLKKTNWMLDIWSEVGKNHKDWRLFILGDSPFFDEMKAYANSIKVDNVIFTGRVDPRKYYKEASVICSTSITESFGLTIVEGMQYGVVPIAFASSSSIFEIVENNGFLIQPFNKKEFAKELCCIIEDTNKRVEMSNRCLKSSREYEENRILPCWIKLINELSLRK